MPLDWPFLPSLVLQRTRRVRPEEVDACRCMLQWLRSAELVIDEEGPGQGPGLLDPLPLAVRFARLASLFLFGMRYCVSLVHLPTYTVHYSLITARYECNPVLYDTSLQCTVLMPVDIRCFVLIWQMASCSSTRR